MTERRGRQHVTGGCAAVLAGCVWLVTNASAHKPITSPYTFYEDVLPITQARCGRCHAPDGIAPMSLLTHEAAVPWGESMRLELVEGHMPPGAIASPPGRFRDTGRLSARELNVLLTWATGGTPPGDPAKATSAAAPSPEPTPGPPAEILVLPRVELASGETTRVVETILRLGARPRRLAAVDLRPGTPSIVRSARMVVRQRDRTGGVTERVVGLWVPGADVDVLQDRRAWSVGPGAELVVRTVYRKRWDREREPATDESAVALYDADAAQGTEADALEAVAGPGEPTERRLTAVVAVPKPMALLALWPDTALGGATVLIELVANGRRTTLAAFAARPGWERRHWLTRPEPLPRGSRIEVSATWAPPAAMPPAGARLLGFDVAAGD